MAHLLRQFAHLALPLALGLSVPALISDAYAQAPEIQTLIDRIDRLQREMTALQRSVYRGDAPPAAAQGPAGARDAQIEAPVAALSVRVGELEREIAGLTGRIEEQGFQIRQLTERLTRVTADIDFRLKELAAQPGASSRPSASVTPAPAAAAPAPAAPAQQAAAAPPQPAPGQQQGVRILGTVRPADVEAVRPPAATPAPAPAAARPAAAPAPAPQVAAATPPNADIQYEQAYSLLLKRDYAGAEASLRSFTQANPGHAKTPDANYWLGETYFVREDYAQAARAFAAGYQQHPKHERASSNLLKMGLSLKALDRKQDACVTFARLLEEFPTAAANIRDRAQTERKALACT